MSHPSGSTRTGVSVSDWTPDELRNITILRTRQEEAVAGLLEQDRSADQVKVAIDLTSDTAEAMARHIRNPMSPPLACEKGCNWCCYQMVGVTAPEAFRIVRHLNSEEMQASRGAIIERLRNLDKITRGMSAASRPRIPKPCAFLGDDGRCAIYAVRPMACAEFTSYDEAVCKRAKRVGQDKAPAVHEKARMLAYFSVKEGMVNAFQKTMPEADMHLLELSAAVVTALNHPDAETAWLQGQPVMKPAHVSAPRPVSR